MFWNKKAVPSPRGNVRLQKSILRKAKQPSKCNLFQKALFNG